MSTIPLPRYYNLGEFLSSYVCDFTRMVPFLQARVESKVYNKDMKQKALIAIFLSLIIAGLKIMPIPQEKPTNSPMVLTEKTATSSTKNTLLAGFSRVVRVVDGDTIVVEIDGVQEKIRLIGVDTPEVVDPRKPVQCFGKEASLFTKNNLDGTIVRLDQDLSQGDRDKYGRLLRYVFLVDGSLFNKMLIAEGYAHEYTYRIPYRYQKDFKLAEKTARETQKGLWSPSVCVN